MSVENGIITPGSAIGGVEFSFFGVQRRADGYYHWGDLVLSPNINPKSKNKPVEFPYEDTEVIGGVTYNKKTQLTGNMRLKVNYGHTFVEYNNALAAIHGVAGGTNFPYSRPQSWGRPADLWGYDHNAVNWYALSTSITSISKGGTAQVNLEGIEEIFTFGALSGLSVNNVNFGFLMWNTSFSTTQAQVYFLSLTNMANSTQQLGTLLAGGKLTLSTTNIPQGSWRMYPCVTTASFTKDSFNYIRTEDANGRWFPYPFCNTHIINVVAAGSGEDTVIDSITVEDYSYELQLTDSANLVYTLTNLVLKVVNDSSTAYDVTVSASIGNIVSGARTFIATVRVPANGEAYATLLDAKSEEDYYRFSIGEGTPVLNVVYSLVKDGQTQQSSTTIDLDKISN